MSGRCGQELCENWAGDGEVCICALFDIEQRRETEPELHDWDEPDWAEFA